MIYVHRKTAVRFTMSRPTLSVLIFQRERAKDRQTDVKSDRQSDRKTDRDRDTKRETQAQM